MLACARLGRDPLGGVRRLRGGRAGRAHRRLAAPSSWSRRRAASRPARVVEYKPLLDRALELVAEPPERCIIVQRPAARGRARARARRRLGRGDGRRRARRLRPGRGDRPALHPLHVRHDRAAEGHRARQRRPRRRAGVVDGRDLRRRARRGVLGGLGHRLGRRPLLHRLRAAAARLHDGALRGQAGRHARRRRVLARLRRPRRRRAVHRADRDPRDQARGPARRARRGRTTSSRFRTLFLAGERCDPDTLPGRRRCSRGRSSTTGGRPRPAGRSRPTASGSSSCRSSPARRPSRCRATTCGCSTRTAARSRRARSARSACAAAAARLQPDAVGQRRALGRDLPRAPTPATT